MSEIENEPLLSPEETDALLDAMRAGGDAVGVDSIDLGAPDRFLRSVLPKADRVACAFSAPASAALRWTLGSAVRVENDPSDIVPLSVLLSSLQPGSAVATVVSSAGNPGILVLGPRLVSVILDRRMGAPLDLTEQPAQATDRLSAVDCRVLGPVLSHLVECFSSLWCELRGELRLERVLPRPQDIPPLSQSDPWLRLALRAAFVNAPLGEIILALSASAVRDTREEAPLVPPPVPTVSERARIVKRIEATVVESVAILGSCGSSIGQLLSLSVGDVLRLESVPGEPVELRVGDVTVSWGTPVVHHGNLALEITRTC